MQIKDVSVLTAVLVVLLLISTQCVKGSGDGSREQDMMFNTGWKFIRDSVPGAELPGYDDSAWITVDLPHDFSIMDLPGDDTEEQIGPFSEKSPGNGNPTGHVMGGTGWYRKHFVLKNEDQEKTVRLKFDGVYMESELWVNGRKLGENKNGYTPFWFNISPYLKDAGETNTIAVKVENKGRNSRWYSGSGIYRNVHLLLDHPVHVVPWGVHVNTPMVGANRATAAINATIQNDLKGDANAEITCNILNEEGRVVASSTESKELKAQGQITTSKLLEISNPKLWSLEQPNMYLAEIVIKVNDKVTDTYRQSFGFRTIGISAEQGFLLNGNPMLLKGGCLHHDNGLLGAAAFERAEIRKVELMKANGFNAIRISHNPPSEIFLDACDRLGMLVINEFTDMWETYKSPLDYSQYFAGHWEKDLTNMILRDRNHPSIIMWSIGNEILKNSMEDALRIGKQLAGRVRFLDSTRAVTEAVTSLFTPVDWDSTGPLLALLDASGYNYKFGQYEMDHASFPDRIMYGSESFPLNAYDSWKQVETHPYVIGDFVWTAMDYLGETALANSSYVPEEQQTVFKLPENLSLPPGFNIWDYTQQLPSEWPNYISWCGDLDITGQKKPQSLYRDVLWDNSDIEINVHEFIPEGMAENVSGWGWPKEYPHWNWPHYEGKILEVRIFTKAPEVRLYLNGEAVGEKILTDQNQYVASFKVPYEAGELKAIALEDGKEVGSKILSTPGEPVAIRITPERTKIKANRSDLAYVMIEVTDEKGQLVQDNDIEISIELSGNGEIIASGNASPDGMESVNKPVLKIYQGKAQAIIRPNAVAGEIKFSANARGLSGDEVVLKIH